MVGEFSSRLKVVFFCFFVSFVCFCCFGDDLRFTRRQYKTISIQIKSTPKIELDRWTPSFALKSEILINRDEAPKETYRSKTKKAGKSRYCENIRELNNLVMYIFEFLFKGKGRENRRIGQPTRVVKLPFSRPIQSDFKDESKELMTPFFHPCEGEWCKTVWKNPTAFEYRIFHRGVQRARDGINFVPSTAQDVRSRRDTYAMLGGEAGHNECANFTVTIKYEEEYRVWNNFSMMYRGQMFHFYQYRVTNHGLKVCASVDVSVQRKWRDWITQEKEKMAYKQCNVSVDGFFWENYTLYKNFSVFLRVTEQLFDWHDYGISAAHFTVCSAKLSLSCDYHLFRVKYREQYIVWKNFSLFYNNKMYDYREYRFNNNTLEMCASHDSRVQAIWKTTISWDKVITDSFYCGFNFGMLKTKHVKYYVVSKQFTVYAAESAQLFKKDEYMVQFPGTLAICEIHLTPKTFEFTEGDMTVCNDSIIRIAYDDNYVVRKDFSLIYKDKVYDYTQYRALNDSIKICNSTADFVQKIWKMRNFYVKQFRHRKGCNKPVFYVTFKRKYYTVDKDFRVSIIPTKQVFSMYDYGVVDGKLRVCVEKVPSYLFVIAVYELYVIAPFSALAFSVICLLLLLLVYALLPELRTLPGLNLMSFSFANLLCLFYLITFFSLYGRVGTLLKLNCENLKITETSIKYAILMNAVVNIYHLKKTFCSATLVRSDKSKLKTFLKYSIFSWGVPVVITVVYIVLVKTKVLRFYMHITGVDHKGDICAADHNIPYWLDVIGSYVLPGSILLYIIVMFVFTAYRIRQKLKASSDIAQKSNIVKNRKSYVLLLKLSTTTAVSWFLPLVIAQHAMYYINKFEVFKAITIALVTMMLLNGVYIAFAFVFTRQNYQLLKKRYFPRKNTPVN